VRHYWLRTSGLSGCERIEQRLKERQLLRQQPERFAVMGCDAEIANRLSVLHRWIPCIAIPPILGMCLVKVFHEFVAVCFGQNTGSGNVQEPPVALYLCFMGNGSVGFESIAIHRNKMGLSAQIIERPVHRQHAGIENVDFVDFGWTATAHPPEKGFFFDNLSQRFALRLANLIGIVEPRMVKISGKNDRCRHYRTGQTTPASFIAASFELEFADFG